MMAIPWFLGVFPAPLAVRDTRSHDPPSVFHLKRQGTNLLAVQPMFTLFFKMFFTIQNEISNMLAALQ
jgi:hypothetical protein